jgi:hypothetical protein
MIIYLKQFLVITCLFIFNFKAWALLGEDLKCKSKKEKNKESITATVVDYSFAQELSVKYGKKTCYYKIINIHDGRGAAAEYIEFSLEKNKQKCSKENTKKFMDKGFFKLVKTKEGLINHILVVRGEDSLSCDLLNFKKKAFIKD